MVRIDLKALVATLISIVTISIPAAPPVELWTQRYDGPPGRARDEAQRVLRDAAGDIVVFGSSEDSNASVDLITAKFSGADGSLIWSRRYDGPDRLDESAGAVALDRAGNVVVLASSDQAGPGRAIYTAKYAGTDGAILWEKFQASANQIIFAGLAIDPSGNIILGASLGDGDRYAQYFAKVSPLDGAKLWERQHTNSISPASYLRSMVLDSSGNILVTGTMDLALYTAKYSGVDGAIIWSQKKAASNHDEGLSIVVDSKSNPIVTSFRQTDFNYDIFTVKYAAGDGTPLWEREYNGPENQGDYPAELALDSSDNVFLVGSSSTNLYAAKYSADGATLWEKRISGRANFLLGFSSVAVDQNGDVVATGALTNYYTAKLAGASGATLWEFRSPVDSGRDVVLSSDGDAFVIAEDDWDFYIARHDNANGAARWTATFGLPAKGVDWPVANAFDPQGNIVVFGVSNHDMHTIKYSPDGAVLWQRRFDDSDSIGGSPAAMKVDINGNVIVAGTTQIRTNDYSPTVMYLAKYAATTGALLWEKRIAHSFPLSAAVAGIEVDASGDVFLFGHFNDLVLGQDIYTAKYSGADGRQLWERIYAGAALLRDTARTLMLDNDGNVIISGHVFDSYPGPQYYTAKYSGATGAIIWENRSVDGLYLTRRTDRFGNLIAIRSTDYGLSNYLAKIDVLTGTLVRDEMQIKPAGRGEGFVVAPGGEVFLFSITSGKPSRQNPFGVNSLLIEKFSAAGDKLWADQYATITNREISILGSEFDRAGNLVFSMGIRPPSRNIPDSRIVKIAAGSGAVLWELDKPGHAISSLLIGPGNNLAVIGSADVDFVSSLYRDETPPALTLSRLGNELVISWPAPYLNWRLESRPNDLASTNTLPWVPQAVPVGSTTFSIPVNLSEKVRFFRLARP